MIHDSPGGTREQYEEVGRRLTDGRGLDSLEAWPVEGILSHAAGPTDDGWRVIDVWPSTALAALSSPSSKRSGCRASPGSFLSTTS